MKQIFSAFRDALAAGVYMATVASVIVLMVGGSILALWWLARAVL